MSLLNIANKSANKQKLPNKKHIPLMIGAHGTVAICDTAFELDRSSKHLKGDFRHFSSATHKTVFIFDIYFKRI